MPSFIKVSHCILSQIPQLFSIEELCNVPPIFRDEMSLLTFLLPIYEQFLLGPQKLLNGAGGAHL